MQWMMAHLLCYALSSSLEMIHEPHFTEGKETQGPPPLIFSVYLWICSAYVLHKLTTYWGKKNLVWKTRGCPVEQPCMQAINSQGASIAQLQTETASFCFPIAMLCLRLVAHRQTWKSSFGFCFPVRDPSAKGIYEKTSICKWKSTFTFK